MKYFNVAEKLMWYPYVFYETEKRSLYTFCPNCGYEEELSLDREHTVKWYKEFHSPSCGCFLSSRPIYKKSRYNYKNLNVSRDFGEFEKNDDGSVSLNVYKVVGSFDSSNYYDVYAFRRFPDVSYELVTVITFLPDGKVKYKTRYYVPMYSHSVSIGEFREVKKWSVTRFSWSLIYESFEEVKGTFLEKYIPYVKGFYDRLNYSSENCYDETESALLVLYYQKKCLTTLWKGGFYELVNNLLGRFMLIGLSRHYSYEYKGIKNSYCSFRLNERGKDLSKILRVNVDELDKFVSREKCTLKDLEYAYNFTVVAKKNGLSLSKENYNVYVSARTGFIEQLQNLKADFKKTFKYIRNQVRKEKNFVSDYYDYLDDLITLNIEMNDALMYPSNFKSTHSRYAELRKLFGEQEKIKKYSARFLTVAKKMREYEYSDGQFKIYPVRTAKDLIKESERMHNCSAGYLERIAKGSCAIFVVRELAHPNKAYGMCEISLNNFQPVKLVQNRAIGNRIPTSECKEFVNSWFNCIASCFLHSSAKY